MAGPFLLLKADTLFETVSMAHRLLTVSPHFSTSFATNSPNGDRFSFLFPIKNVKIDVIIFMCRYTYSDIAIYTIAYFAA